MGRDAQARPARGDDDVALFQVSVERHGRPSIFGLNADDLRLLSCPPRADDLVIKTPEPLAQVICQLREVSRDALYPGLGQQSQAGFEAVNQRGDARACLPGESPARPGLFKVIVVFGLWHTRPPDKRRLDSLSRAIREIKKPHAFGRQKPFVASSGGGVYQLRFNIDWQSSHCLNHVNDEQRVACARCAPKSLKVCAKARSVLNMADGDDARMVVNETD